MPLSPLILVSEAIKPKCEEENTLNLDNYIEKWENVFGSNNEDKPVIPSADSKKRDITKTEHPRARFQIPYKKNEDKEKVELMRLAEYILEEVYEYLPQQTSSPNDPSTTKIYEETKISLIGRIDESLAKVEDIELYEKYALKIRQWARDLVCFSLFYGEKKAITIFMNNLEGIKPNDRETERTKSFLEMLENRLVYSSV